jgi:hypothetical protein
VTEHFFNTVAYGSIIPQQFTQITEQQTIAAYNLAYGSDCVAATINGPRHWVLDAITSLGGITSSPDVLTVGGIQFGLAAQLQSPVGTPTAGDIPYVRNTVQRNTTYTFPHPHRHRAARQRAAAHAGPPLAVPPGKPQHLTSPIQVPDGLAKSHWQSIRPAYEVGRHDFQPVAGGWQARNPGHQWTMPFDRCGFLSRPRAGAWTWGWSCKATASATSNSASTTNCLDANGLGTYLKKATAGTNGLFEVIDSSGSSEPSRY